MEPSEKGAPASRPSWNVCARERGTIGKAGRAASKSRAGVVTADGSVAGAQAAAPEAGLGASWHPCSKASVLTWHQLVEAQRRRHGRLAGDAWQQRGRRSAAGAAGGPGCAGGAAAALLLISHDQGLDACRRARACTGWLLLPDHPLVRGRQQMGRAGFTARRGGGIARHATASMAARNDSRRRLVSMRQISAAAQGCCVVL